MPTCPRRITATGRSGAILITSVLGNARSTETPATAGMRVECDLDLFCVDRDEAVTHEVVGRSLDVSLESRRSAVDLDRVDGEDGGRVGDPVGEADRDQGSERRRGANGRKGRSARDPGEHRPHLAETGRRRLPQQHADAIHVHSVPRPCAWIRRGDSASYVRRRVRGGPRTRPRARARRRTPRALAAAPRTSAPGNRRSSLRRRSR